MAEEIHRPQGYPRMEQTYESKTVTDALEGTGYADIDSFINDLPSLGDSFSFSNAFSTCTLKKVSPAYRNDTNIFVAELVYDDSNSPTISEAKYIEKWSFSNTGITKRIEEALNDSDAAALNSSNAYSYTFTGITPGTYYKKWNNDLYTSSNASSSNITTGEQIYDKAGFYNIGTSMVTGDPDGLFEEYFQIVESPAEIKTHTWQLGDTGRQWRLHKGRTKPGVTDFIVSAPTVVRARTYKDKSDAETACSSVSSWVGSKHTPSETYGISGGEWLVTEVTADFADKAYSSFVSIKYVWANVWDSDLYA